MVEKVVGLGGETSGECSVLLKSIVLQYDMNDRWH